MADKKNEKTGYYFKIIPKEEIPKFMERLKNALEKTDNKKDDKKFIDFEIRGTKEDLDGLGVEIFSFDQINCDDYLDLENENIKNALYCLTLSFDVLDETGVEKVRHAFERLKPILYYIQKFKDKIEFSFRNKGTTISLDCTVKDGKLVKALIDLDIDISEYQKFIIAFKTGINLAEIFDSDGDQRENFLKICSILFSIKSETYNMRYLLIALAEALRDVKLKNENIQKKYNIFIEFLNFINSFIGGRFLFEYDAKVFAGEVIKGDEKKTGGVEGLKTKITAMQQFTIGMAKSFLILIKDRFEMVGAVKSIDFDCITIILGLPKYQIGLAASLNFPGLTQVLGGLLDNY